MRAFLSYSLSDSQDYVVTVLARQLREKGYTLMTGHSGSYYSTLDAHESVLRTCSLFIGVITEGSDEVNRVTHEYNKADEWRIPALLLMEQSIAADSGLLNHPNVVAYNRYDPSTAIQTVRKRVAHAKAPGTKQTDDTAAWILGGAAVLALIALLSSKK
ncbi:MAG: hypothetical protein KJZ58_07760 [Flavobacteriales bacterium]|nr:hypothetical protein [Flavobacteriales bacterium]